MSFYTLIIACQGHISIVTAIFESCDFGGTGDSGGNGNSDGNVDSSISGNSVEFSNSCECGASGESGSSVDSDKSFNLFNRQKFQNQNLWKVK